MEIQAFSHKSICVLLITCVLEVFTSHQRLSAKIVCGCFFPTLNESVKLTSVAAKLVAKWFGSIIYPNPVPSHATCPFP